MIRAARLLTVLAWLAAGALIVLATRSVAYALAAPSRFGEQLQHSAGGPRFVVVALVALGLGVVASTGILWLAALGVRERHRLEPRRPAPRLRPQRLFVTAAALFLCCSVACALLESYIHWRAGIGFHGLSCLSGPVHRDFVPLVAAFSLVAAAVAEALRHVLAWMRATLRLLAAGRSLRAAPLAFAPAPAACDEPPTRLLGPLARPRAPPTPLAV